MPPQRGPGASVGCPPPTIRMWELGQGGFAIWGFCFGPGMSFGVDQHFLLLRQVGLKGAPIPGSLWLFPCGGDAEVVVELLMAPGPVLCLKHLQRPLPRGRGLGVYGWLGGARTKGYSRP